MPSNQLTATKVKLVLLDTLLRMVELLHEYGLDTAPKTCFRKMVFPKNMIFKHIIAKTFYEGHKNRQGKTFTTIIKISQVAPSP